MEGRKNESPTNYGKKRSGKWRQQHFVMAHQPPASVFYCSWSWKYPKKKSREARYSSIWGCKNFTITPSEKRTKWKRSYEICIWSFWPRAQVRGQGRVPVVERCPVSVPVCGNFIKVQVNMLIPTFKMVALGIPRPGRLETKENNIRREKNVASSSSREITCNEGKQMPRQDGQKTKKKRKRKERVYAYVYERKENLSR